MHADTDDDSSLPDPQPDPPPDVEWALYPKTRPRRRLRQLPLVDYENMEAASRRQTIAARRQEDRDTRDRLILRRLELETRASQPVRPALLSSYGIRPESLRAPPPPPNPDGPHITKAALSRPKLAILMAHRHAELELLRSRHQLTEELEATARTPFSLSRTARSSKPGSSGSAIEPLPSILAATSRTSASQHRVAEDDLAELRELGATFECRRLTCCEARRCGVARKPNVSLAVSTQGLKDAAFARPLYLF